MGFPEFYRVLLGFTGFYWVLRNWFSICQFFLWFLPGDTDFQRVLLGLSRFNSLCLDFTGFYRVFRVWLSSWPRVDRVTNRRHVSASTIPCGACLFRENKKGKEKRKEKTRRFPFPLSVATSPPEEEGLPRLITPCGVTGPTSGVSFICFFFFFYKKRTFSHLSDAKENVTKRPLPPDDPFWGHDPQVREYRSFRRLLAISWKNTMTPRTTPMGSRPTS